MTYTDQQLKYLAWCLTRRRGAGDEERYTGVLAQAQVDLNPHQVEAALFAFRSPLSMGAILADEVGLGKTIEAGIVISQQWAERKRRILVIAPATLRKQWSAEMDEKFFLPSVIMEKKNFDEDLNRKYRNPFETNPEAIVICSYQFAKKQIEHIKRVQWDLVVVDEAHKLRNVYKGNSKISSVIKEGIAPYKKLLLTATPLQNDIKELYGLISVIDDNYFGNLKGFTNQYSKVALRSDEAYKDLRERIAPIIHRTLRSQVQEYVKYTERKAMVQEYYPNEKEAELYEKVTEYLQRDNSFGLPNGQRELITLVLYKLLSSSTFAIAQTLGSIINRLKKLLKDNTPEEDEKLAQDISKDFELFDEYAEEIELSDDDAEENEEEDNKNDNKLTADDLEHIKEEIAELKSYYDLAISIATNNKGECLLKALDIAFKTSGEYGGHNKALIFTESTRTQLYVKDLLEAKGYKGEIVLFNGGNKDALSTAIYKDWLIKNEATQKITGSATADRRQAIVDYFRDEAQIMIATEAASEGINLQFCSLVVNYDLPWNPQRVEQRIGRCHRYGQKNDVVVINFVNKANKADERVYELLDQKFCLFKGVFGASDQVLGQVMDGVDFEHRVLGIMRSCRSESEIDKAFDELQEAMKSNIDSRMNKTQLSLIENFDEEVVNKMNLEQRHKETRENVSKFNLDLYNLTVNMLAKYIVSKNDKIQRFSIRNLEAVVKRIAKNGVYQIGNEQSDAINYGINHPLAQYVITKTKSLDTPPAEIEFNYSGHRGKISKFEDKKCKSGNLYVDKVTFASEKQIREYICTVAVTDSGLSMDEDFASKLMSLSGIVVKIGDVTDGESTQIKDLKLKALKNKVAIEDKTNTDNEIKKIERWADDQTFALEQELKTLKSSIKDKERQLHSSIELAEILSLESEINRLRKQQKAKRRDLFDLEDGIDDKRNYIIDKIKGSMTQTVSSEELFRIHWTII